MKGIIALLPDELDAKVRAAAAYLQTHFGLTHIPTAPHISFHIAGDYTDNVSAEAIMRDIANQTPPLNIKLAGLGIFKIPDSGEAVLYATVVRTPEVDALRAAFFTALGSLTTDFHPLYVANEHVPHITFGHVSHAVLGDAISWLHEQDWQFTFKCEQLALVEAAGDSFIMSKTALLSS